MKKYSLFIIGALLLITGSLFAQAPKIYTIPAAFDVNEDITLYLDVTGTGLDGVEGNMFLWSWSDAGDNIHNGAWGTSFTNALTKVKDNLYSVKVNMGKDYPAGSTKFQGLVVLQDGTVKTDDSAEIFPYDFGKLNSVNGAIYPELFTATTSLSIMVNLNNGGTIDLNTPAVYMHSGLDNWLGVNVAFDSDKNKTALSKVEGHEGIWRINLIPTEYYGIEETAKITNIMAVFNNGTWDQKIDAGDGDFCFIPKVAEEGPTAAKFFLAKFTANDVLPIVVNTTVFAQAVIDSETGEETAPADPLLGYNGSTIEYIITLKNGDESLETKKFVAKKTADYTYTLVLLPVRQFAAAADATDIEVRFSSGNMESETVLKGSFIK